MSQYASPVPLRELVGSLRNVAVGVTLASLILVPSVRLPANQTMRQTGQENVELVTTIPDGPFDLRIAHYRTPHGLDTPLYMPAIKANDEIEREDIPFALRDITGLPVETLASLVGVSRYAYYKWLDGKGVSDEHVARLNELFHIFRTLQDLHGSGLKEFLETAGPAGRPIDLLAHGESSAVLGLALRQPPRAVDSSISHLARQISGLSGWLRPATRLHWGVSQSNIAEQEEALYRLGPRPLSDEPEAFTEADKDDEAFVAWGFVLE